MEATLFGIVENYTKDLTKFYRDNGLDEKRGLEFAAKYWNPSSTSNSTPTVSGGERKRPEVPLPSSSAEEVTPAPKRVNAAKPNKCITVMANKTVCGVPTATQYCGRHVPKEAKETKEPKEAKVKSESSDTATKQPKSKGREMNSKQPSKEAITDALIKKRISYISKNEWGNFEHPETNITFDPETEKPIFFQLPNGQVRALTDSELEKAKSMHVERKLNITINKFGNQEYFDDQSKTHFVYNDSTSKIVGVQREDDTIAPLTVSTIEICKELRIDFVLPEKLGEITVQLSSLQFEDETLYEDMIEEDE